jgi:hypothetical protein
MKQAHGLIARAGAHQAATPEHKRFARLLDQIDKARECLAAWQAQLPLFAQAHAAKVQPLRQRLAAAHHAWAFELEQLLLQRKWSKADQATLARAIVDLSSALLGSGAAGDDDALKALHDRHAERSFDEEGRQQLDLMKSMLETVGDVDLGDDPAASADELMRRMHEQMAQRAEAQQAERPRKGRAKAQTAAQKRAAEDAARVSQTVREVYRKLASALHPDRAPADASAAERATRTEQMARANAAYEAGDLLALLSLQLQIEQVDAAHVAGVAAAQVKHFNAVLAEQLAELQAEIDGRQMAFSDSYGILGARRLDPNKLGPLLQDEVRELLAAEQHLLRDQRLLRADPAVARAWLKQLRQEQRFEDNFY